MNHNPSGHGFLRLINPTTGIDVLITTILECHETPPCLPGMVRPPEVHPEVWFELINLREKK
jgi:hypothetical protein